MNSFLHKHGVSWSGIIFSLRTTVASLIALYIALALNLDSPKWAPMTVWIVAQHTRGMSLSKGQYRVAGTCVGAIVAVAMISAFPQSPEFFTLALAIWVGFCTSLSTATFNFRSYGAALAGYTATIIALDSVTDPQNVFNIATARVLDIIIGIITEGILQAIFSQELKPNDIRRQINDFGRKCLRLSFALLRDEEKEPGAVYKLFSQGLSLDAFLTYSATDSSNIRRNRADLLNYLSASLHLLAFTYNIDKYDTPNNQKNIKTRWSELFKKWREQQKIILAPSFLPNSRHSGFILNIDRTATIHNGLRSAISMIAAMCIWIYFGGSLGAGFVTIVAVICSLFSTRKNSVAGSLSFLKGTVFAVAASAICNFWLLPLTSGFEMKAIFLFCFLFIGGVLMRHPTMAGSAASFAIFFWDLINPQNSTLMNPENFLNGALTLFLGMACATLIFALLFPSSTNAVRNRLHNAAKRDLKWLGLYPREITQEAWLSRCAGRLGHESAFDLELNDENATFKFDSMMAVWMIGDAVIQFNNKTTNHPRFAQANSAIFNALKTTDLNYLSDVCSRFSISLKEQAHYLINPERALLEEGAMLLETIHFAIVYQTAD